MNRLDALKARVVAAQQEVYALCEGKHRWTMTVPVQPTDSDEVIGDALDGIERLVAVVEEVLAMQPGERSVALNDALAYWLESEQVIK
jgi:hypothetical protein